MSNTEKSAGIFGGPSAAEREQLLQQFYGKRLLSSAGAGAGLGLGAAALYHLLRSAKPEGKKERKYPSYGSGTPMIAKAASFAPQQQNPTGFLTQQNQTTDIRDMLGLPKGRISMGGPAAPTLNPFQGANPLFNPFGKPGWASAQGGMPGMMGAGIAPQQRPMSPGVNGGLGIGQGSGPGINGGLTNAPNPGLSVLSPFGKPGWAREQGGIAGSSNPYSAKIAFDLNSLSESVGKMLPTTMVPFGAPNVPGRGPAPSADPHPWRKSWSTAANIGGAALGTYAGAKLINSLVKAKKKRDRESALNAARAEYYSALGAKSAAFQPHVLGGAGVGGVLGALAGAYRSEKGKKLRGALQGGAVGAGLGAGAGALISRARAGKRLLPGLPPPPASGPSPVGPKSPVTPPAAPAAAKPAVAPVTPPAAPAAAARPPLPDPPGWNAPYDPERIRRSNRDVVEILDDTGYFNYDGSWARRAAENAARRPPPPRPQPPTKSAAFDAAINDYHAALVGEQAGALDVAFETVKQSNMLTDTASAMWNTPQTLRTAYLLTLLGAGGLGAKYMYDRTKNLTEGENLAKAQASRARTKGLPPVWVDPESLAHIKSTVESDE